MMIDSGAGDPRDSLVRASHACLAVVETIKPGQLALPTPCREWSLGTLIEHLTIGNDMFVKALGAEPTSVEVRCSPADPAGALARSFTDVIAAFCAAGALERQVVLPIGAVLGEAACHLRTVEALVHGWDIGTSIDAEFRVHDDLATGELAFASAILPAVRASRPEGHPSPLQ